MLLFGFVGGCIGFCHRTESDIFPFLLTSQRSSFIDAVLNIVNARDKTKSGLSSPRSVSVAIDFLCTTEG